MIHAVNTTVCNRFGDDVDCMERRLGSYAKSRLGCVCCKRKGLTQVPKKINRKDLKEVSMQRNSVSRISIIKSMGAYLPTLRRLSLTAVAVGALASAAVAADSAGFGESGNEHWVGTSGSALHAPDHVVPGLRNTGFTKQ